MALFHTTVVDNQIKALSTIGSASGSIATFETDKAENLVNLEVAITATGGGGTPVSPIAINGFSACNLSVNGTTETIPFGQTVYGGRLNVGSGVLTITHAIKTFDGSESFGIMSGQRCVINISGIKVNPLSQIDDLICSHYEVVTQGASGDNYVYKAGENTAVVFRDSVHCVDVATFQAYLANQYSNGTPVQLVYWLATPLTIQLDSKQIQAIIGTNNIYADTGDIIDLKFVLSVGQAIS